MNRKFTICILILAILVTVFGCSKNENLKGSNGKLQVVVSFNPLAEYVEAIGKDMVETTVIIPEGTEAHDFEPTAKDIQKLSQSSVFIYNGLGMESWVEQTVESASNSNLLIVDSSKGVDAIKDESGEHGVYDPHIWLSLNAAKVQAGNIKDALIEKDPDNKEVYEKNYESFDAELSSLYDEYKQKFQSVSNKDFVTGHAAFAYLCREFGLNQNSVEDVFAEGEPTTQRLKELTDYCKKNNIKVVFMEELASPKVSEALAKEVGAKVQKIYAIESREDGKNYLQSMRENLEAIYTSLK